MNASSICGINFSASTAFQSLARIDREGYRTWAAEWIEGRLLREGVAVGPDEKAAIWSALGSLAGALVEQRTMTGLSVLLQSNTLRQALSPYVLGGAHSNRIVIAGRDSAQDSINQVGQEITRRNMNIQPTLTERPGLPVLIIVDRDLVLRPYQPLFFNWGASQ